MMPFLTSKDVVCDRSAGLTAGGDDYVTKPFSPEEVVLRLRAITRSTRSREEQIDDGVLRYGPGPPKATASRHPGHP
ncbi:response regulator [Nonomuraea jabiensis]|uniref:hypothetical protein n=1 Tax=Nonomuraea jabiensis TaxID=882448 RepID=UPI0036A5FD91